MSYPIHLNGVMAKLLRAEEHLKVLHDEIMKYVGECTSAAQLPTKINSDINTIRLTFAPLPEPSVLISMIVGDCVHNARSSLDHLWKRLGGSKNWPLFSELEGPKNWSASRAAKLVGVATEAHEIIDKLQPCYLEQKAPTHPLAVLNKLSNLDKHQAIHLTRPRSKDTRFAFRAKGSTEELFVVQPPVVFHDHTEVLITDVPEGSVRPGMDVNIRGTLFVSFKEDGPWGDAEVQRVLLSSINFIRDEVVAPLTPFTS